MRNTKSSLSRADAGGDQKQDYHLEWPKCDAAFEQYHTATYSKVVGTLFMSSIGTARGAHSPSFIKTDHSNSIRPLHINVSNKCAFETFNLQSKATTIVH